MEPDGMIGYENYTQRVYDYNNEWCIDFFATIFKYYMIERDRDRCGHAKIKSFSDWPTERRPPDAPFWRGSAARRRWEKAEAKVLWIERGRRVGPNPYRDRNFMRYGELTFS